MNNNFIKVIVKKSKKCLAFTLISAFLFAHNALAYDLPQNFPTEAFWYDGKWAFEHSKIPYDKNVHYGKLANGFRYAIVPHKQSKERVSLYLVVQAGSLMEKDNELGYAHYVEHMAFNGSKNFPAGSLIPYFQENGMSFGGDTNAHTSLLETVYKLNIASNTPKSWNDALVILRDFADGLLFEEKEVAEEFGVILSEKKDRDNEASQNRQERQKNLFPNTKFSNPVIGTDETLNAVTADKLRHFYSTWYTPDRMVLVVVGDVNNKKLIPLIENNFKSIKKAPQKSIVEPFGDPKNQGLRFFYEKRSIEGTNISIAYHLPRNHKRDSISLQKESYIDSVIEYIIQRRLQIFTQDNPTVWNFARFTNRGTQGIVPTISFTATTTDMKWEKALTASIQTLKQIAQYGISQEELNEATANIQQRVERYKKQFPKLENQDIADNFVAVLNADRVYTSLDYDIKLLNSFQKELTIEEVNHKIKTIVDNKNCSIVIGANKSIAKKSIEKVWNTAQKAEVAPYKIAQKMDFPYLAIPKIPKTKAEFEIAEVAKVEKNILKRYETSLQNGANLNILPIPFASDKVQITLLFGNGFANLSKKEIINAKASNLLLTMSGLGKLSLADTKQVAEKIGGTIKETYGQHERTISIEGDANKLEALMQAVWTQYTDPTITENAFIRAKSALQNQEFSQNNSVAGFVNANANTFFYGNEKRFQPLTLREFENVQKKEVEKSIFENRFTNVKILISGTVDHKKAYELAEQYFGQIPLEPVKEVQSVKALSFPKGKSVTEKVTDTVDQAVILLAFNNNIENIADREEIALRQLANTVLKDKLRKELREKMGATYSPSSIYRYLSNENGYGLLQISINTDKAHLEEVSAYLNNLKSWEVSEEELNRLRLPILTAIESSKKNPRKWQNLLYAEVSQNEPYFAWDNQYYDIIKNATAKDVNKTLSVLLESPKALWRVYSQVKEVQ